MKEIIDDLFSVYTDLIDGNNAKIYPVINNKYTHVDKTMLTAYLYINSLIDMQISDDFAKDKIINYINRCTVSSNFVGVEMLDENRREQFDRLFHSEAKRKIKSKNRLLKKIEISYHTLDSNYDYDNLILFFEDLADLFILLDLYSSGNKEAFSKIQQLIGKLDSRWTDRENFQSQVVYREVTQIINGIKETSDLSDEQYKVSGYYNLSKVVLNLKNIEKYPTATLRVSEDMLFNTYALTIISTCIYNYLDGSGEKLGKYDVVFKALFYNFMEFNGNRIKKLHRNDEWDTLINLQEEANEILLHNLTSDMIFGLAMQCEDGSEGYLVETMSKLMSAMKVLIEVSYMGNYSLVRFLDEIDEESFKPLYGEIVRAEQLRDKKFFKMLIVQMFIHIRMEY